MSDKVNGLKKALAASREANRQLKSKNNQLLKIIKESNMKGTEELLSLESNYFGGIFDRLGQVSRWLTAIAWDKYPNQSFEDLKKEVSEFSPYLAKIIDEYGIDFAVIAPNEENPLMVGQLRWRSRYVLYREVFPESIHSMRVYLREAFLDVPSNLSDELEEAISSHEERLEEAFDNFSLKLLDEVQSDLKALDLSIEKLETIS